MMLVVSFIFVDFWDVSWIRHLVSLKPTVEGENLPSISGHLRMGWITTKKATRSLEILWFPALGIWTYKWEDLFCLIAGHDFSGAEPKSGNRPESRDPLVAVYVFSETFGKVIRRGPFSSHICAVPWPHARHVFSKTFYCGELVVHRLFIHQLKHVKTTFAKISPKNPWKSPGIYGNIWKHLLNPPDLPFLSISCPRNRFHRFHSYSAGRTVPLEPPPVDPSTSAPLRPPARSRLCHPGAKLEVFDTQGLKMVYIKMCRGQNLQGVCSYGNLWI